MAAFPNSSGTTKCVVIGTVIKLIQADIIGPKENAINLL